MRGGGVVTSHSRGGVVRLPQALTFDIIILKSLRCVVVGKNYFSRPYPPSQNTALIQALSNQKFQFY